MGIIIGLIVFIACSVGFIYIKKPKILRTTILIVGTALLIFSIIGSVMASVPTGNTGILTTFGKVEPYTLSSGIHFKAPWQKVICMDNRVQRITYENLQCFSKDIQEVSMVYIANYQIKEQNAMDIYKNIGKNYQDTIINPCLRESVKIITAKYTAEQLVVSRAELADGIREELTKRLDTYDIILVDAAIANLDFTDSYTDAVEAKQVAQQNKLRAETEAQQKKIEAQAAADVKVIQVQADADARMITAQAEADALLISANAEAEANRTISDSLTDKLLEKAYYDTWNGQLPSTILGGSNDVIMNIPNNIE